MKKSLFVRLFSLMAVIVIFIGCQDDLLDDSNAFQQEFTQSNDLKGVYLFGYCGDPVVNTLFADKEIEVGTVTVGNDDETLFVTFAVTGEWFMANTKVWVGTDAGDIPVNKSGNPKRGKFTKDDDHEAPFTQIMTYQIPLSEIAGLPVIGDDVIVAAHAEVVTYDIIEEEVVITDKEGAWGFGEGTFGGKAWGWYLTYALQECPVWVCGEPITDGRDGSVYNTVLINDQCWFEENLAFLPAVSPPATMAYDLPHYYVYDYDGTDVVAAKATGNYSAYGALYNWVASTSACPEGTHLPSDEEIVALLSYLGEETAGLQMKSTTGWSEGGNGTNSSGFNGLPAGYHDGFAGFVHQGEDCSTWTSTIYDESLAWYLTLYYNIDGVFHTAYPKSGGLPVRCIID